MNNNDIIRIVDPSLDNLDTLTPKLNDGELKLLRHLDKHLDIGWEIYIQPPMNGLRPDFVVLHPSFGIGIFEVKDWRPPESGELQYNPDTKRLLRRLPNGKYCVNSSQPIDIALNYKTTLIESISGVLSQDVNYGLVTTVLVFPQWSRDHIENLFSASLARDKKFSHPQTNMIVGKDEIEKSDILAIFPRAQNNHPKMTNEIHAATRSWLSSAEFDNEQSRYPSSIVEFDSNQKYVFDQMSSGYRRIKGAAGTGKSLLLTRRAAQLHAEGKRVLILCYNIVLTNYLRDLAVRFDRSSRDMEVKHYHGWAKAFCVFFGYEPEWNSLWVSGEGLEVVSETRVPALIDRIISEIDLSEHDFSERVKYDAILVDEGQDFNLNWWKNLRSLLTNNGEMLLVSDPTQDVYGSASKWTEEAMTGAGFRGPWREIKICHRMPVLLHRLTNDFARKFLKMQELSAPQEQNDLFELVELNWIQTPSSETPTETIVSEIIKLPERVEKFGDNAKPLNWSDIVFLCSENKLGRAVVETLESRNFNVTQSFAQDRKRQRSQKLHFYKGSGRIKASTFLSYKGLESRAMVLFIDTPKSEQEKCAIYAALTRLKKRPEGSLLTVICNWPEAAEYGATWHGVSAARLHRPVEQISDNQTGISFEFLFGDCLSGAKRIVLTDPYVRAPWQMRNLREFITTIESKNTVNQLVQFHLVTGFALETDKLSEDDQERELHNIKHFAKHKNVEFSWKREKGHDRLIQTDTGWDISLGRGLDIYKGFESSSPLKGNQNLRKCRPCRIDYRKQDRP